jgi:hypothetical protein
MSPSYRPALAIATVVLVTLFPPLLSAQVGQPNRAWHIDSTEAHPVYGRRLYRASLPADTLVVMMLVCDQQRRQYVQFFTLPLRQSPVPFTPTSPATEIAYRFDDDRPVTGLIALIEDPAPFGNAVWYPALARLGGLDVRQFWLHVRSSRRLVMSFRGLDGELYGRWLFPANTDSIRTSLERRCG